MQERNRIFSEYERAGFTLARKTNHCIWRCKCGRHQLVTPASPGEGRAVANALAQLRKTLRECAA